MPPTTPTPTRPPSPPLRLRDLLRRQWKTFVAVLGGNFIYFALLYRWLPPHARHRRNQIDLGLLIDFWLCVFIYGVLVFRFRRKKEH
ncbi:MAG: hypothetical protein EXQ56_05585 [Acidobacteria bacterium]|nr:hypothetical protein [Acidobacteriota bacterium]